MAGTMDYSNQAKVDKAHARATHRNASLSLDAEDGGDRLLFGLCEVYICFDCILRRLQSAGELGL
jgi:hypothetical protein